MLTSCTSMTPFPQPKSSMELFVDMRLLLVSHSTTLFTLAFPNLI